MISPCDPSASRSRAAGRHGRLRLVPPAEAVRPRQFVVDARAVCQQLERPGAADLHLVRGEPVMSESNGAIIRKAYEDFAKGNIPAVFAVFDPAITWHVPGHSPLSGDYEGHEQIGAFLKRTMELSGGAFSIDVHNVLADGDLVVCLTTVTARRNRESASFPEVHVWRLKNGKVTAFR